MSYRLKSLVQCATVSIQNNFLLRKLLSLKCIMTLHLRLIKVNITAVTLLTLSAASDNIDHNTLIERLSTWYGISGTVLTWCSSYLTDKLQTVKITDWFRVYFQLHVAFPRVLLLCLCSSPSTLHHPVLWSKTMIRITTFMQMIPRFTYRASRSLWQLNDCLQDISLWMTNNKLKLSNKIEYLIIDNPVQRRKLVWLSPTCFLRQTFIPATSVRNLSMIYDHNLTLDNISLKRVVAVCIVSAIFASFAGICHLMPTLPTFSATNYMNTIVFIFHFCGRHYKLLFFELETFQ